ncbi:hypothetical protein DPMN_132896 [Dreissena polymorpha]|uniref:Uncharacterized protein n=1 Tax=Dreissena polymorpha TaxID=45954 RepID=A0A9D4JE94_DREPO|nr:hypothetical protein DPMN_132896 [Dreissena polymorpha]
MGIDWNSRQDGTKRPRRLRGNSSASRVGSSGTRHEMALCFWEYTTRQTPTQTHSHRLTYTVTGLVIPSGNFPSVKYVSLTQSQANIINHMLTITPGNTHLGKTHLLTSTTRAQETVQTRAAQLALYRFVAGSQSRGMCAFRWPGTGTTLLPLFTFRNDATQRRNRTGATDELKVPLA